MGQHCLKLSGGLSGCCDSLHALSAPQLDSCLEALLQPMAVLANGQPGSLPALAGLPLAAQANLLLLLRAAPHRFSSAQRARLLGAASDAAASGALGAGLLQHLAAEAGGREAAAPPCPGFLFSAQPCLPWVPKLVDEATAAALQRQQAAAHVQHQRLERQQAEQAEDGRGAGSHKRPTAGGEPEPGSPFAKRLRPAPPLPVAAAAADQAAAELEAAVAAVRRALSEHAAGAGESAALAAVPSELSAALHTLLAHVAAGSPAGEAALQASGLASLADDALLLCLLRDQIAPGASFARCAAAGRALLLPRLRALDGTAPRDLAAAVEHLGSCNPQAYVSSCLGPLLGGGSGLNQHQAELLSGSLKASLPAGLLPSVLAAACEGGAGSGGGGGAAGWNEHTVAVLQAVLNAKPALGAPAVAQLAAALQAAASGPSGLAGSAKFAKLALSLVKQCPREAAAAKAPLAAAAAACTSFMAKALAAAVAKL